MVKVDYKLEYATTNVHKTNYFYIFMKLTFKLKLFSICLLKSTAILSPMVFCKFCFFSFLYSLLSTSSLSIPINDVVGNRDCCCFCNNLGHVDTSVSWSTSISKTATYVILVMIVLNIVVHKFRQLHETSLVQDDKKRASLSPEHLCREFLLGEMKLATKNFDESMIIGKGGFGKVYRGVIDDGDAPTSVAIKRMDLKSRQGADEFWTEIKTLSKFRHGHLVSLVGYCNELDEMMVVYEYIAGGNLGEYLHKCNRSSKKCPLFWVERLKICIGAARGLDYLHTGTGVIHRDVKSSNILIDKNMTAKLSDLGVSKIGPVNQPFTHISTDVKGSFGYFDPNYFQTRRLTRKSDVYSFGVVLLEVLCGRPAVDPSLEDNELGLVGWAQRFIRKGSFNDIIDPVLMGLTPCFRVKGQIMPDCLNAFVEIADKCLHSHPKQRPTMSEVVVALEAALALQERGDYAVVRSRLTNERHSNLKSGKMITLSRKLRNILPAKTKSSPVRPDPFDVEPQEMKKTPNRWFHPSTFYNEVLPSKLSDTSQEVRVADSGLKIYSLDGLKTATRNFSDDMVLGEGAFGKVYKGWVERETYVPSTFGSGIPVAVKKLDTDGYQGFEEWQTEVKLLSELRHPNLVKLLGYCADDKDLLLVYEFMHNGSLENYILKKLVERMLSWSMRIKIMIGIAQGIAFLHNPENQIIFRDLKTSNILLDEDFTAKIADFGLARTGPINGDTHLSTQVMGTCGYAAPEYVATGHLNGSNDIYAFGVVLLETITGLRVFDKTRPENEQNLVEWTRPMLPNKKKVRTILDPSLGNDYQPEAAYQCAQLVLKCTRPESHDRPSIKQVLRSLERISRIKTKFLKERG